MKKIIILTLILTLAAGLFTGCSKKKGDPPVLPPTGSMTIDFSYFVVAKKSASILNEANANLGVENVNWTLASTIANIWNDILTGTLVVPVAAFKVAVNHTPVYVDTKKWEWNYTAQAIGATYNVRLVGEIGASFVNWTMYVSRTGVNPIAEFIWFTGTSALDGKSGQWILNHSKDFVEPMLQIDWVVTGTKLGSIKYTYVRDKKDDRSSDNFKGSYIEYGTTSAALNAYYTVHLNMTGALNDFEDVNIEWSTTDHNGHIKAPYFYSDSAWHCWDGNGNDVVCN